ncbi:MAG: damage-inducible protein [Dehalococcoidia bacterium]|nr:damage-inducible protein [Dehalococcoidia bacterium]
MASFLDPEQRTLVQEIAELLTERGETVCIADGTSGGLISAALLSFPGASRYYAGGAVLYTLKSRIALAGAPAEMFAGYRGTTIEIMEATANALRQRLEATWCIAESGVAGPTGGRSGRALGTTLISIAGPVNHSEVIETGLDEREANMVEFATRSLRLLRDAIRNA